MSENKKGYRGVNMKKALLDDVDKFIEEYPEAGYVSTSDFVAEAVRVRIQAVQSRYAQEQQAES